MAEHAYHGHNRDYPPPLRLWLHTCTMMVSYLSSPHRTCDKDISCYVILWELSTQSLRRGHDSISVHVSLADWPNEYHHLPASVSFNHIDTSFSFSRRRRGSLSVEERTLSAYVYSEWFLSRSLWHSGCGDQIHIAPDRR